MPTVPKNKECETLGCRNPRSTQSVHCICHGGSDVVKASSASRIKRGANDKLYHSKEWSKIRARTLSTHPLCQRCLDTGKVTAGHHVDHVFPHKQIATRFKLNIFQSLCASCHTLKGQDERRGVYYHYDRTGAKVYVESDYGRIFGRSDE